jgi:hypothetical protein
MNVVYEIMKKSSAMELVLFAGVICLALTAGYASMALRHPVAMTEITGSTHPMKVTPLQTMQAMPEAVDAQK